MLPAGCRFRGVATKTLRIAIVGSSTAPIAQPFAGGLESHVWHLARALHQRGHRVTLFAAPGSDVGVRTEELVPASLELTAESRRDTSMPAEQFMADHHAYLSLMLDLAGPRRQMYDVVHNHSLHHLPLAMSPALRSPLVTTLHTPPTPWLESAFRALSEQNPTPGRRREVAVSADTARRWQQVIGPVAVIPNGVALDSWPVGPGGPDLVWSGRIVPEKGLDLAIAAARRAGRRLRIAGPVSDIHYFRTSIAPELDADIRYVGHLDRPSLQRLVGHSAACVVTPRWDEPYGLVVAEALASATPVVAFRRGGIPEIVDDSCAVLVAPDDVTALAEGIERAAILDRSACRRRASDHCRLDLMVDRYEALYRAVIAVN